VSDDKDELVQVSPVDPNRDIHGRFLPGHPGGPGAVKGAPRKIELVAVCRRKAKQEGRDLEDLLWGVVKGLMVKAGKGNAACGKLILDRFCGMMEKAPEVNVNVDNRQVNAGTGPPMPSVGQLQEYFQDLVNLSGGTPGLEVSDPVALEAIDELLR
jgi:hypothetical protein